MTLSWVLILALVLCWPAVAVDCGGTPDNVVRYSITVGAIVLEGLDANGDPIYVSTSGPVVSDVPAHPAVVCSPELMEDPPLGSVYLYDVEAIDPEENSSGTCPG